MGQRRIVCVGIDDTDVRESRGTGYLARTLVASIVARHAAEALGITRHQLLVDPRIPYTSHNSSACIAVRTEVAVDALVTHAAEFLASTAAVGSDPGLCVASLDEVAPSITSFGERAKREVVPMREAIELAHSLPIHLSPHGGTGLGVVGALAAVGLRAGGNDGRFIALGRIRELAGATTVAVLREAGIAAFAAAGARVELHEEERIDVGDWCRPLLRDGVPTLLVEEVEDGAVRWRARPRDHIRSH